MNPLEWPLWMILGAGTAYLFLRTQKWSVQRITPEKPVLSQVLVLGGMLLRWLMIALILILAFQRSALAGLLVFITFMIVRLVILALWEKQWRLTTVQTNSQKE
jgi:hypothetical protein